MSRIRFAATAEPHLAGQDRPDLPFSTITHLHNWVWTTEPWLDRFDRELLDIGHPEALLEKRARARELNGQLRRWTFEELARRSHADRRNDPLRIPQFVLDAGAELEAIGSALSAVFTTARKMFEAYKTGATTGLPAHAQVGFAAVEDEAQTLARACRVVRAHPESFATGLAYIEKEYSEEAIVAHAEAKLAEIRTIYGNATPPIASKYTNGRESARNAMWRIGAVKNWALEQNMSMGRTEAQAVILIAAWLADDEPNWSQGLPALFESWVIESWRNSASENREERSGEQRQVLRMLRFELAHSADYRKKFVHVIKLAFARLDAAGVDVGDSADTAGIRDSEQPTRVEAPEAKLRGQRSRRQREKVSDEWIYMKEAEVKYRVSKSNLSDWKNADLQRDEWAADKNSGEVRFLITALERMLRAHGRLD